MTIREFLLVILVGITAGAYSSIGIASQLLVAWEEGELDRLFFWRRPAASVGQPSA
ncbi:preprotein translocase subunit SecF [compost metagenome]